MRDELAETVILVISLISVFAVFSIFLFMFMESYPVIKEYGIFRMITSMDWHPTSKPPSFGILPLIYATLAVTAGSIVISLPSGVMAALYLSEFSSHRTRELLKPVIEILAGIPSVVYGFFGLVVIVPFLQTAFGLSTGETAFTGALLLAVMSLPTIISVSEDAFNSVPKEYREASLALGATRVETAFRVVLPSAISGVATSAILGIGRAIGETMTVLMVTGGSAVIPKPIYNLLTPVRPMTATLAAEMGETVVGSLHYSALFAIGVFLFLLTFIINLVAGYISRRYGVMG